MTIRRLAITAVATTLALTAAARAEGPRPGLWEMTTQMEAEDMPPIPQGALQHCFKEGELSQDQPMAGDMDEEEDCTILESNASGNTSRMKMRCKGGMVMTSETTYAADSFQTVSVTEDPESGKMTIRTTGRRIGDCK